ncbi:MAG: diacylglycerol kinase [Candidatus Eremiobacterota bacterium]
MKRLIDRFRWAFRGMASAWREEANFRIQAAAAVLALGTLAWLEAPAQWWATFLLCIGGVMSLELVNTALENMLDALHPAQHPLVAKAKDCAAGATLLFSLVSVCVFIAFLAERCVTG